MDTQKIMVIRQNVDGDSRSGEELYYSLDGDQASEGARSHLYPALNITLWSNHDWIVFSSDSSS